MSVPQEGTTTLAGFPDTVHRNLTPMMFAEAALCVRILALLWNLNTRLTLGLSSVEVFFELMMNAVGAVETVL